MVMKKYTLVCFLVTMLAYSCVSAEQTDRTLTFSGLFNLMKQSVGYEQEIQADQPDIYDELDLYITMFLKGAQVIPTIANTTDCVNATRDLARGFDQSVQNIINNGFSVDTYLKATEAVGEAQPMIKTCFGPGFDGYKQAAEHLSNFKNTKAFFEKMGLKVAYSFFDWYGLYFDLDAAVSKKNMTMVSFFAGQVVHTLLDFDSSLNGTFSDSSLTANGPEPNNFASFIYDLTYNFLDGAMILQSQQIEDCGTNATGFIHNFDYAIDEFKKHTDEGVKNGVYAIADNFGIFHNVNEICVGGVDAAWAKVQEYLKIKTAPLEIIFNIVWNYRKVYKHMTQAIECSFSMDAKCIGYHSGSLIYQIFAKHK